MLLHRGRTKDEPALISSTPDTMGSEHVDQHSMSVPRPYSSLKFFSSSPVRQPSKLNDSKDTWAASFLTDLRFNRPARPSGSRPLPGRNANTTPIPTLEGPPQTSSAISRPSCLTVKTESHPLPEYGNIVKATSHRRTLSSVLAREHVGRPLAHQPQIDIVVMGDTASAPSADVVPGNLLGNVPNIPYQERGQRWMEKQEAHSLRQALEDMDLRAELKIHEAAQEEATDLVWRHRNAGLPYKSPDGPRDYRQHLRKGSHARSQSGRYGALANARGIYVTDHRSASEGSTSTTNTVQSTASSRVSSGSSTAHDTVNVNRPEEILTKSEMEWDSPKKRNYMNLTFPMPPAKAFTSRRSSGSKARASSGRGHQGLFRNPEDQIYEEPEEIAAIPRDPASTGEIAPLSPKNRNSSANLKYSKFVPDNSTITPILGSKNILSSGNELHKNRPSQSRDPSYKCNSPPAVAANSTVVGEAEVPTATATMKKGIEIRSDEIRAATSMRLKDRSPKLPSPTVISDRPDRPIVSFDLNYKPREVELRQEKSTSSRPDSRDGSSRILPLLPLKPKMPASSISAPMVPTINICEPPTIHTIDEHPVPTIDSPKLPSISISGFEGPSINVSEATGLARPLPSAAVDRVRAAHSHRPTTHHSATEPVPSHNSYWTAAPNRITAQCEACALPISGRIVSAAMKRFHPACFSCFQCGELLECVAFYPEPEEFRNSRLARISARLNDQPWNVQAEITHLHHTEEDDGDDSLRFYCHLDFHEKFSPRCRSCKTPIEGEVIVACGGEWHVGHFFCAECGDPFDASTPFVEKEGFAWCVDCHSRRFSGKCAGCRRPVTDTVVQALGKEWHETCFCCKVCCRRVVSEMVFCFEIGHG